MYDEVASIIRNTLRLKNRYMISTEEIMKTIKVLHTRNIKAIEFVEMNPLIWKPNMELSKLIGNPELKDRLYYTSDEWLHKLHTILKGDDENEK